MRLRDRIEDAIMTLSSTEIASASQMTQSPIDAAANVLITRPLQRKIGQNYYIRFGTNDDIPEILSTLIGKSSTHAGIVGKKGAMIAGKNLLVDNGTKKGAASIELDVFLKNAGGKNKSLNKEFKRAAYNYVAYGAAIFLATFKGKGNIIGIKSISPHQIRMGLPNPQGEIDTVVWRQIFKPVSTPIFNQPEKLYPMYDKDSSAKEQIIYIAAPESGNPYYGLPRYIGAYNFIEADYEFGVTIKNAATNGFSPKVLASFIGRSMSDEQKATEAKKIKENFQGSDGENMIVSWVRRKEDVPEFTPLNVSNLDKTVTAMSQLNDAKILTAHSVTIPTLFGVVTNQSKLGVSGTELQDGYAILMSSEIVPARNIILEPLQYLFENSQFSKYVLSVEDEPLIHYEAAGGTNGTNRVTKTADPAVQATPVDKTATAAPVKPVNSKANG